MNSRFYPLFLVLIFQSGVLYSQETITYNLKNDCSIENCYERKVKHFRVYVNDTTYENFYKTFSWTEPDTMDTARVKPYRKMKHSYYLIHILEERAYCCCIYDTKKQKWLSNIRIFNGKWENKRILHGKIVSESRKEIIYFGKMKLFRITHMNKKVKVKKR